MGGLKRKIDTEKKIEAKDPRAVAHSKRCKGLFRKASAFCRLSEDSQLAIIATPVSSNSHASFYSFGHSSVDSVVEAFLADHDRDDDDEKLGFWWEDESLANSDDPKELSEALGYMRRMLHDLKQPHESSSNLCVQQDHVVVPCAEEQNLDHGCDLVLDDDFDIDKIYEILSNSDFASTMDEELPYKQSDCVDVEKEQGVSLVTHQQQILNCSSGDQVYDFEIDHDVFHNISEEEQTLTVSSGCHQDDDFDMDQIFDFVTNSGFPSIDDVFFLNNSEAV